MYSVNVSAFVVYII